jgi:hypothetical protein
MSTFEIISVVGLMFSGLFAMIMLWYKASEKLEDVRFRNTELAQSKLERAIGALAKDLAGFKEGMGEQVQLVIERVHALEIVMAKQSGEMRSSAEEMRTAYEAFSSDWKRLRKGWGEEVSPGKFVVREPKE